MMRTPSFRRALLAACGLFLAATVLHAEPVRPPELKNRQEIISLLLASEAGSVIRLGISASAEVMVEVDEKGRVAKHQLVRRTGNPILDAELRQLAKRLAFVPAMDEGRPIRAWVVVPFSFGEGTVH